jgi:hypothetical protein
MDVLTIYNQQEVCKTKKMDVLTIYIQQELSKNVFKKTDTIWLFNIAMENHICFLIGNPSINGPFPMAMLVITRG